MSARQIFDEIKNLANEYVTLFDISGIPCRLTSAWIIYMTGLGMFLFMKEDASYAGLVVLSTIVAYMSVVLHEYGHALVSQQFGGTDLTVTIYPYSGLASGDMDSLHKHGLFWTIIAGPAVNAVLAILGWVGMFFLGDNGKTVCSVVIAINTAMAFFNVLPIYPLDGGRVVKIFFQQYFGDIAGFRTTLTLGIAVYLLAATISFKTEYFVFPVIGLLLLGSGWLEYFDDKQKAVAAEVDEMRDYFLSPIYEASKQLSPEELKGFSDAYLSALETFEGQAERAVEFRGDIMDLGRTAGWKAATTKLGCGSV